VEFESEKGCCWQKSIQAFGAELDGHALRGWFGAPPGGTQITDS
jgi:hypothetical protein